MIRNYDCSFINFDKNWSFQKNLFTSFVILQKLIFFFVILHKFWIGLVYDNGPGGRSPNPSRVIPQTPKKVLDAALLNTQHYKVRIKGKVEQSRERSIALLYTQVQQLLKREPQGHPRLNLEMLQLYSLFQVGLVEYQPSLLI